MLKEIPSYVPGDAPTVPGHEAVVRIEAVGPAVKDLKPGQRFLVQTDYRWLRTATSNGAFGDGREGHDVAGGGFDAFTGRRGTLGLGRRAGRAVGVCRRRLCLH
ncbi:MAG: alcohol dehydrogenase catalytic domain-containing protein [Planctomycetota bacterium]